MYINWKLWGMQKNKETDIEKYIMENSFSLKKNILKNSFSLIIVASLLNPGRGSFRAGF